MKTQHAQQPVVITGFGALTALGHDITTTWQALKAGQSGIAPITRWKSEDWPYPLGAEIKNFDARKLLPDRKIMKFLSRHDISGLNVAQQALDHSHILEYRESLTQKSAQDEFNDRSGIYVGSAGNLYSQQYDFLPLLAKSKADLRVFAQKLFAEVHPMWLLRSLPNNVLGHAGIACGFKGHNQNITNHVVGGLQALIEAKHAIASGKIDRALVIAYDIGFEPQSLIYYAGLGILSDSAIKSFDAKRNGTIMGEGAAAVVLESEAVAKARQATIYGELVAGSSVSEGQGVFKIRKDGDGVKRAVQNTLAQTTLAPAAIGMVCAHGNGNVLSDASESQALGEIFAPKVVPVTAFKWAVGHTLCASGVLDTLFTLLSLRENRVPGIATLEQQARDCEAIAVDQAQQVPRSDVGMVISRGFGSMNSCLLLKAYA